jgi:hypothetical protein
MEGVLAAGIALTELAGIPGLSAGATCAPAGTPAAIESAAAPVKTWIVRFQFTKPSSSSWLAGHLARAVNVLP